MQEGVALTQNLLNPYEALPKIQDKELQKRAPILDALQNYREVVRFHMPGHRGGRGADPGVVSLLGEKAYFNDVTGVLGMDDLHEPHGCIQEAESLAAKAFGADATFFSVNGTSGAIQAMILATVNDGDSIIIPRNIHKSILSAIILAGARPIFLLPEYDQHLGFALGIPENALKNLFEENPEAKKAKAALLVNPTYYGTSIDLEPLARLFHEQSTTLLVDEAHGVHFRFHPFLPKTSLESGADAVAQGAHKIVGALTQASYLHVKGTRIDRARLKACFQYLTTTSPSYLLMASLDAARRQMALFGRELLDYAIGLSMALREEVNQIPGLYAFGPEIAGRPGMDYLDPTKVTITVRDLGITGYQAERFLRHKKGIQVEMSDLYNVLVIVSFGNSPKEILELVDGLKTLAKAVREGEIEKDLFHQGEIPVIPRIPELHMTPRKAVESPWERVPLEEVNGRVSAEVVTCYPPGIPIIFPGEILGQDTIEYLKIIKKLAFGVSGPEDRTLTTLRVVKDVWKGVS